MRVVAQPRLGHHGAHPLDEPREALRARAALRLVARVDARDAAALAHEVHRAVLGHAPVDRPLPHDDLAPPARTAGDRDEREPGVAQGPERVVRGARQDAVREERVVEVEEQPAEPLASSAPSAESGLMGARPAAPGPATARARDLIAPRCGR